MPRTMTETEQAIFNAEVRYYDAVVMLHVPVTYRLANYEQNKLNADIAHAALLALTNSENCDRIAIAANQAVDALRQHRQQYFA